MTSRGIVSSPPHASPFPEREGPDHWAEPSESDGPPPRVFELSREASQKLADTLPIDSLFNQRAEPDIGLAVDPALRDCQIGYRALSAPPQAFDPKGRRVYAFQAGEFELVLTEGLPSDPRNPVPLTLGVALNGALVSGRQAYLNLDNDRGFALIRALRALGGFDFSSMLATRERDALDGSTPAGATGPRAPKL